jgi:K319-like protein
MSVICMFTQNLSIPGVYADTTEHNHSLINEISDKVVSGDTSKAAIQQILQQIQTQITQRSGQEKATAALKQIQSLIELNPTGTLSQSILSLARQQASGNTAAVNQAAVQIATLVASGSDYVGQPLQQAGSVSSSSSSPVNVSSSSSSSLAAPGAQSYLSSIASGLPPVANAGHPGPDQVVDGGSPVTLDGSASFSPANDPITFAWKQTEGPTVALSGDNTAKVTFTAPNVPQNTALKFQLTVTDTKNQLSDTDAAFLLVRQTITPPPSPTPTPSPLPTPTPTPPPTSNLPPVANAGHPGPDQVVDGGSPVTLDGSASHDPDGDQLAFSWKQTEGPAVALSGDNTAKVTFTAPNVPQNTALKFQLTVTDSAGLSDSDTVNILVRQGNPNPTPIRFD